MHIEQQKYNSDLKSSYGLNLRKSVIVTLACFILLIYLSPRISVKVEQSDLSNIIIDVENIPITHQLRRKPPPPKPQLPVPSDDESIPEDETIEETTLKYTNIFDYTPDGVPGIGGKSSTPPRPIAWVFPEYPEDEKKKGVKGVVRLSIHINEQGKVIEVVVLSNTTGSQKCAKAAIDAAYGSRFFPAKEGKKAVNYWITQPYRFDLKE